MKLRPDWDDGNYMEWADQERLVRQDLEEMRKRNTENHRVAENEEDKHG